MDLHGQTTEYLICELLKFGRLGEWTNDHRGGSGAVSMRSDVNHRRLGRRNGRSCHDGMAKHVDAVMKRAKDRRIALTNTSELRTVLTNTGRVAQRLTQPISPHKRLKERAGIWMFAKQSEVITEPNMITSSMQRRVREDVRAVMAEDSRDRRQNWNKAGQGAENSINRNIVFPMPLSADNIFSIHPCFRHSKDLCLFPADPLLLDYAERILSALPQLFLRNDDSTSYSVAATSIVACSLRRHGVCPKGSNFQQKELELSQRENDMHEKFWRSFFENMSPLNSFSVDSAFLTSDSSSAKLFEFEDIPASNEHVLSNSDDANTISDVYQSPKTSSSNNILDCSFSDFPKIGKNDVASLTNLSVNSNDLMKLAIDDDFGTNILCNLPAAQPEFDLNEYHPITVNTWFEKYSPNMSNASKAIYHNAKNGRSWPIYRPMEYSFTEPVISDSMNTNQWMKNSSIRKKIRSGVPDFRFKLNHEACNAFDSVCGSQASQFSFDF
ncbi:unnamed protein product [Brugia pahangi]|uniref:Fork-head domain-containing protein n=1 Tax=Brugia pahangi TaxID=6280 RepID=A0A158PQA1_BRUPA|nr:unnamed protein product [Brugia pahangi]